MTKRRNKLACPWVHVDNATPESLWDDYISRRKPVVLRGHPKEISSGTEKWKNEYLKKVAGRRYVSVEYRTKESDGFGLGKRRTMAFSEFLSRIEQGQENLYLTSPQQPLGPHGLPDLMAPPALDLMQDFPVRPSFAGNLIPQQINIWMGNSDKGTSSGLHHDYHDNFYILLRGRKRFRLFPPGCIDNMYTYGDVVSMHPNGRIVYKGQENTLPDGSNADDVRRWNEGCKDPRAAEKVDDDTPLPSDQKDPPSFSRVDLRRSQNEIISKFEKFPFDECIECTLSAGQMLYLPAGYFHEVTSMNAGSPMDDMPGHMALNYWLYPPDNLIPGRSGFMQPYRSGYWEDMWRSGNIRLGARPSRKGIARKKRVSKLIAKYGRRWKWYYLRN